ncbi:LppU family putative lipoprotein [Mycobacterium sp.]|uniref:LppU family putative lipoprotein n=1 Tax=Mycobacterium sp. TaxID=1785 RepID=UPI0039C8C98C
MQTLPAVITAALIAVGGLTGCSSAATVDMQVGDCLKMGGTPDRPEATKAECGSPESNFKVAASVENSDQCPADVDSYYSMRSAFSDTSNTICMDIDWVVGGCMSIDPENDKDPVRVDCNDSSVPNRQRATQILKNVASVDQCASGVGYPYDVRNFTVCVEDVS